MDHFAKIQNLLLNDLFATARLYTYIHYIMTPSEKAKQLVHKFYFSLPNNGGFTGPCNINDRWDEGKMCAMMAADEVLDHVDMVGDEAAITYWQEVKQEINKNYVRNTIK